MKTVMNRRNGLLDLIKLICISMVLITHIKWSEMERNCLIFPYIINMAVPVFLTISMYIRTKQSLSEESGSVFKWKNMAASVFNIIIPFLFFIVSEILMALIFRYNGIATEYLPDYEFLVSVKKFLVWTLLGGAGPGGYYFLIIIQLILIFPLLNLLFRKNSVGG